MPYTPLSLFKKHVMADDFSADDDVLTSYLQSAEAAVISATRRTAAELLNMGGGEFPVELRQAVLLLGGMWYMQRENISQTQMHGIPYGMEYLIKPFRKFSDDSGEDAL